MDKYLIFKDIFDDVKYSKCLIFDIIGECIIMMNNNNITVSIDLNGKGLDVVGDILKKIDYAVNNDVECHVNIDIKDSNEESSYLKDNHQHNDCLCIEEDKSIKSSIGDIRLFCTQCGKELGKIQTREWIYRNKKKINESDDLNSSKYHHFCSHKCSNIYSGKGRTEKLGTWNLLVSKVRDISKCSICGKKLSEYQIRRVLYRNKKYINSLPNNKNIEVAHYCCKKCAGLGNRKKEN